MSKRKNAKTRKITFLDRRAVVPDSPHFSFKNGILRFSAIPKGAEVVVNDSDGLVNLPVAADVAARWYDSRAGAIRKKCSDEGRVHDRYGIEDEPESEEFEENCDNATCWACIADAARTKLGWPTPMPTIRESEERREHEAQG